MKSIAIYCIFLSIALQSCTSTNRLIDHDYSYETNFGNFHTFNFVKCDSDTSEYCAEIQATIQKQMEIRGYKFDPNKADVYIGFNLLTDKVKYKSFLQPKLVSWIKNYDIKETYSAEKYSFHHGMIMLSMLDAKTNALIWRGFASDISNRKKQDYNMNHYYSSAIRNIFKEYTLFASNK